MDSGNTIYGPSYPVKTIAVAVSFSPYCQSVLSEAKYLSEALNSSLLLIHVGEKTEVKEQETNEMIRHLKIDPNQSPIIWAEEGTEVKTILDLCDKNKVDLLVLGARVKENMFKFYIGSIARKISRKAKCSVMLVTSPATVPHQYNKIVINGADNLKTENTIDTALYFAEHLKTKEVYVVQELDVNVSLISDAPVNTLKQQKELQTNDSLIRSIIKKHAGKDLQIINKTVKGKTGYAIKKFAQTKKADLLVINSPDIQLNVMNRIFTHDMEYILANLPCNLLIVHPRVKA